MLIGHGKWHLIVICAVVPVCIRFYDNIYAVYQSWNDISSEVSIDGFTYYADGTNQNKDIQIVGAALTGTTLANTGIYSKTR